MNEFLFFNPNNWTFCLALQSLEVSVLPLNPEVLAILSLSLCWSSLITSASHFDLSLFHALLPNTHPSHVVRHQCLSLQIQYSTWTLANNPFPPRVSFLYLPPRWTFA